MNRYRRLLLSNRPLEARTPCGYCRMPFGRNGNGEVGFEVDHVKPKSRYPDLAEEISNLTWACARCNRKKADHVDGFDPKSLVFLTLLNPNEECWARHFSALLGGKVHGETATGGATIERLKLNEEPLLVEQRAELYETGWWPA